MPSDREEGMEAPQTPPTASRAQGRRQRAAEATRQHGRPRKQGAKEGQEWKGGRARRLPTSSRDLHAREPRPPCGAASVWIPGSAVGGTLFPSSSLWLRHAAEVGDFWERGSWVRLLTESRPAKFCATHSSISLA